MANGWGGRRNGSGRKPPGSNVIPIRPKKDQRPRPMFSDESVMAIVEAIREQKLRARYRPRTAEWNPYIIRPDRFGPVVAHLNKHRRSLAMDQNGSLTDQNMFAVQAWQAGGMMGNDAAEGLLFLGYPFLSEMAQRAEFRLFGEIMSEEMTRKFIDFRGTDDESTKEEDKEKDKDAEEQATPDAAEDKMPPEFRPKEMMPTESNPSALSPEPPEKDGAEQKKPRSDDRNKEIERKIIELRHLADDLKLRQVFKQIAAHDSYFGIAHLFLDLKGANVEDPRDAENRMSIGNGRDEISKAKLSRNCLKGLRTIEPVWCYPTMYNAMNPLHPSWYDPEVWYVMGAEIHKTRLIPFVGRPVPDILKPAYAFGDLPMIQMAQPYVDIWLRTRESVAELIHAFSIMILQTNMGTTIQPGGSGGGAGDVIARMQLMNGLRDNAGMMIIDKATEDLKNVSAPLGTLDHLQAQAQEHMYSVARIPAVKWTGIQPTGLNATSEGELRAFNDTVHGYQEQLFRVGLTTIIDIMMISLWGARDPDIVFDFNELHEMTEKEKAESAKIKAETDQIRVDSGIVSQEEVRAVLVADPDSGYHGLDPEDVPELLQEEEAGLIPEGAGKGLEAELAQAGGGAAGGPQPPKPPFNAPAKPKRAPPFGKGGADQAMDAAMGMADMRGAWEAAKQADQMGYLDGLAGVDVIPDYDQWHSSYLDDSDTIEVQRKLLEDDDAEKTRTLLHEAGHRAQYRVDKAAFRAFQRAGLDTTENFTAMANAVHLADFRCTGHIDDKSGEIFAESYAHWALGMEMPLGLREFWDGRASPGGMAQDADWEESKHPRDKGGKFSSGGGGGGAAAKPKASHTGGPNASPHKPFAPLPALPSMKKVGEKKGTNPGGFYEASNGDKFYVKQPKGPAQVKNENTAARLYQLAGLNTFEYMDAGPGHIATKMEKLDKNNIKQLSPEEKKAAQKDFVTHAWLANWDAAGTGGDNVGVVDGKIKVLDAGGALEYRALGEPKGKDFGANVNEFQTMKDPNKSPDAASLYGDMTKAQMIESAKLVTEIPNNAIIETVKAAGGSDELINKLIARKNDIADQLGLTPAGATNPEWEALHPRGPGGKFAAKPGGEEIHDPTETMTTEQYLASQEPPKFKTKKELIGHLLSKPQGVSMQEVLDATGWPSVSMPAQAAAAGMKLEKKNVGGKVKYFGTPMTEAEKADLKDKAKAKLAAAPAAAPTPPAPAPAPAPPPKPAAAPAGPPPTAAEIEKAKKPQALKMEYIPGEKPTMAQWAESAKKHIDYFNQTWEGKTLTDPNEIANKVAHFKAVQNAVGQLAATEKSVTQAQQAEQSKAAAEQLKKAQEAAKAKNTEFMKQLGITETEAQGFEALTEMLKKYSSGSSSADLVEQFKNYQKEAEKKGYPITGFEYALLRSYINGTYKATNAELRGGAVSQKVNAYRRMLNTALDKLPKYTGTVTRGTSLTAEQIAGYKPGHVVTEHGFTSTGVNFKFGGNVSYSIKAIGKRGADCRIANSGEAEIIFKAGTQFLVHKVETKGGTTHIEMEEVEHHG